MKERGHICIKVADELEHLQQYIFSSFPTQVEKASGERLHLEMMILVEAGDSGKQNFHIAEPCDVLPGTGCAGGSLVFVLLVMINSKG